MHLAFWIIMGIAMAFSAAPITSGRSRSVHQRPFTRLQRKVGLPLPDELRGPVLARIVTRERWQIAGGLIGVGLGGIVAAFLPEGYQGVVVMGAGGLGTSIAGALVAFAGRVELPDGQPRVARITQTTLADYLPAGERQSAWLAVGLAWLAPLIAVAMLLPVGGPERGWPVAVLVMALCTTASAGLALIGTRAVLSRGQRAVDDLELAWDDVLRASALRSLWQVVLTLGAVSCLTACAMVWVATMGSARPGSATLAFTLAMAAVVILLVEWGLLALVWRRERQGEPMRFVLQRLWAGAPFVAPTGQQFSEEASR